MVLRILHSGGTIGSAGSPLAPMPGADFAAAFAARMGHLPAHRLTALDPPIDSGEAVPGDWLRLARAVLEDEAPTLVLHGTDTMAWSAAALSYLFALWTPDGRVAGRRAVPAILTGSQLPLLTADAAGLRPGSDAPGNVAGAAAALPGAAPGVHVWFHGALMQGLRAAKRHSTDPDAFWMPNGPAPLPELPASDGAALRGQLDGIAPHLGRRAVVTLHASPSAPEHDAALVDAVAGMPGLGALVLMGYGTGNMPAREALAPRLGALAGRGVILVATTQLPAGPALSATYSAGSWLAEAGALDAGDMTLPAIGAKLHVLLALAGLHDWDAARVATFFQSPLLGERAA